MRALDVMTLNPICATPEAEVHDLAGLMMKHDCHAILIVESEETLRLVGIVTDRDITLRVIATGRDPTQLRAADCMTAPVVVGTQQMDLRTCCALMRDHRIKTLPVVNETGVCIGMLFLSDVIAKGPKDLALDLFHSLSKQTRRSLTEPGPEI